MKITKRKLKRIIKEELESVLGEGGCAAPDPAQQLADQLGIAVEELASAMEQMGLELSPGQAHSLGGPEDPYEKYSYEEEEFEEPMMEEIIKKALKAALSEDKSGQGKCPSDGCVQKREGHWVVISNKTGECWGRSKKEGGKCTQYDSRSDAEAALDAYHA